jgi:flagellar hook-associated protein 1 FlgK
MSGLNSSLLTAADAMTVFTRSLNVIGNNITNANTPGYATQSQSLTAKLFEPEVGITGGVMAGPLISSRSEYLEQAVRSQTTLLGTAQQTATDLGQIQPLFDLTSTTGVSSSIDNFFASLSQLGVNPNDSTDRQAVLSKAGQLANSINASAAGVNLVATNVSIQTGLVVQNINQLTAQIAGINQQYQVNSGALQDPGLDAQMHTALESLSELTNFTTLKASDGTYSVFIGGQIPAVLGADRFSISSTTVASPQAAIFDAQGNDITSKITQGSLGALIQEKNVTIPGYLSNLNTLASSLADTMNTQLSQGLDQNGNTPTTNLFTYNQNSDAASSLSVTAGFTTDQIAAASAGAPGGNGNIIAAAQLATSPSVNGFTFTQFYGNLAAQVGNNVAGAQQTQIETQAQVTQAQIQRGNQSGVSLNAQAAQLLQYQQAYQAAAKLISVLDSLTQAAISMIPGG